MKGRPASPVRGEMAAVRAVLAAGTAFGGSRHREECEGRHGPPRATAVPAKSAGEEVAGPMELDASLAGGGEFADAFAGHVISASAA